MPEAVSRFDEVAEDYDSQFTFSLLGSLMREAVWRKVRARLQAGQYFLELNCGTGEDAVWLANQRVRVLATDASMKMVEMALRKVAAARLTHSVEVRQLSLEHLADLPGSGFDGVLSNFGGMNCMGDYRAVGRELAARLRPGACAFFCVMGPVCLWEWIWFLAQGKPRKAFRRLAPGGAEWSGMRIYYPSIREFVRAFQPGFRLVQATAIGALLPPPYTEEWARTKPRFIGFLNRWERKLENVTPLPSLADHYLLELTRR